ncbi:hypothetical protein [Candidatus Ichthyocystis hellenicum]|uniref:hypothetical protein n=1 Tax=Candidatus Ichthyocystis hellenicum TaxID=1561003 RepID=UPI000B893126|nr:hypothetical protein [Candidatus Ichthyocystis hellenicum]
MCLLSILLSGNFPFLIHRCCGLCYPCCWSVCVSPVNFPVRGVAALLVVLVTLNGKVVFLTFKQHTRSGYFYRVGDLV